MGTRPCVKSQGDQLQALPKVQAKAPAPFERRALADHTRWRRDCARCAAEEIQARAHRKIRAPEGYVLSLDLLGKHKAGVSERFSMVRCCLVGSFTVFRLEEHKKGSPCKAKDGDAGSPGPKEGDQPQSGPRVKQAGVGPEGDEGPNVFEGDGVDDFGVLAADFAGGLGSSALRDETDRRRGRLTTSRSGPR